MAELASGIGFNAILHSDETVEIDTWNGNVSEKMCSDWSNIIVMSAGLSHTVGIQSDGKILIAEGLADSGHTAE